MRGRLIVFEGGEGAGKSTQLEQLAARLTDARIPHLVFREPGGTPIGDRIREILLHSDDALSPAAEAALFIASRAQLVATAVGPALARGTHVLLDRFLLSTYAYQIHGRGLPEAEIRTANRLATDGLVPDLTILLRVGAAAGLARAGARGAADRMERADRAFHDRVHASFERFGTEAWQQAHPECGPIIPVDGEADPSVVAAEVLTLLSARLPEFAALAGLAGARR